MLRSTTEWISSHADLITAFSVIGLLLFACTIVAAPWLIAQLPVDYFVRQKPSELSRGPQRWALFLIRNVLGLTLLVAGLILLVTPGPGVLVLIAGLSTCDFPHKHALILRLAQKPKIFDSLNWMRAKYSKPPFLK
ncbi:MAG: hypothetical protein KTR35_06715 [Gammaproteobacteria bacterium]|nr:hypothetical protein [Gammaproteobacteria bacterium]